jgi:ABC-type transport system involved in multi-copper enzyme maturation permease subunit
VILGPLFRVELLRLARRGVHFRLRVVLALVLLVGLLATYLRTFPQTDLDGLLFGGAGSADAARLTSFGETFLIAFLIVQQVVVLLITPVYAGGAITDEKERGGMDFLLTTPLTRWELVVGKLAARLTFVLAVLATGLPVLFLTLLFGGVSFERVLAGFAVSAVTVVAVGTFATMLSVYRHTLRDVLLWCYGTIAVLVVFGLCFGSCNDTVAAMSPTSVLWGIIREWRNDTPFGDKTWEFVRDYSLIYLPIAALMLWLAIRNVRTRLRDAPKSASWHPPPWAPPEPVDDPPPAQSDDPPLPEWYRIPERPAIEDDEREEYTTGRSFAVQRLGVDDDPFVWKERYFAGRLPLVEAKWVMMIGGCAVTAFVFALCTGLFVGAANHLSRGEWIDRTVNVVVRIFLVAAVLMVPIIGVRTAVSVTEERAKQTLLSLLTLPVPRRDILRAKLRAAVVRSKWLLYGIVLALALALTTFSIHVAGLAGAAVLIAGYTAFVATLGLWLSVRCANSVRAVLFLLAFVIGTNIAPVLIGPITSSLTSGAETTKWVDVLCPPIGVWQATVRFDEFGLLTSTRDAAASILRPLVAGIGYAGFAYLIWVATVRRFDRDGRS